jgi:glucose/arabinose dehydrogenase
VRFLDLTAARALRAWGAIVGVCVLAVGCGSAQLADTGATPERNASATTDASATAARGLRLVRVGSFDQPTYATGAPGDTHRLFVVEKGGRIVVLVNGHRQGRPFLDITGLVGSNDTEQGLLSMVFAPDYQRSGRFYVCYTIPGNDVRVVQYRRSRHNPNRADAASAKVVLTVAHRYTNHNGGQLQFGPDGDLYVGIGDGGSEGDPMNLGQNTDVLDGKVLRIKPRANGGYSIPKGNPFVGQRRKRPEIWAYGLRNPWRFSFDRLTGDLVIADVGQNQEEEVDFAPRGTGAGANYGWSIWEGDRRNKPGTAPHAVFPVLVTLHSGGYCAIIGGYVVRDRSLGGLYGRYLYGDLCKSQIRSARLSRGRATGDRATGLSVSNLSSFGQDTRGRVYAVSLSGPVYRLATG